MAIRNIVTIYYFGRQEMKINRGASPDTAILNCIKHLQRNDYSARLAQISDSETGKLYAVIKRNITGRITIHYQDQSICIPLIKQDGTMPRDEREGVVSALISATEAWVGSVGSTEAIH